MLYDWFRSRLLSVLFVKYKVVFLSRPSTHVMHLLKVKVKFWVLCIAWLTQLRSALQTQKLQPIGMS